jgi:ATP-dependent exoDNAse (exonuclease V) alpha subunit
MENSRDNIFVTGKAGTGKSVLLKHFVKNTSKKNVIVLAPTGVAAIQAQGQTIHSFFRFKTHLLDPQAVKVNKQTAKIIRKANAFIIDEVSMVRADLMEAINRCCQQAKNNIKPFGGIQMIVFGDLHQLPPVVQSDQEKQFLKHQFGGQFFFDVPAIKNENIKVFELANIQRQKDVLFKDVLNAVRTGIVTQATLDIINARCGIPIPQDDVLTFATTNKTVDDKNTEKFNQLRGQKYVFQAETTGDEKKAVRIADEQLELKVDAQVMMLRNDSEKRWVNGTLGMVSELSEDSVKVRIDGKEHEVEQATWETYNYTFDEAKGEIAQEVVASFTQYPIRLAWALTIHKSQGQTYKTVNIDFGNRAFAHGQAYVALSRCQTLEGLYLTRPLRRNDVIVDERIEHFIAHHLSPIPILR